MLKYVAIIDGNHYHPDLEQFYFLHYYMNGYFCNDCLIYRYSKDVEDFLRGSKSIQNTFLLVLGSQNVLNETLLAMTHYHLSNVVIYVPYIDRKGNYLKDLNLEIHKRLQTSPEKVTLYQYDDESYCVHQINGNLPLNLFAKPSYNELKKVMDKEPSLMRVQIDDKKVIGKYQGFVWLNDYLDSLYIQKSKIMLLKQEKSLKKILKLRECIEEQKLWKIPDIVEMWDGVQIEIEMKNNINSINIDSRNIKNAPNKLVLKPAQNIFLIK